jgi:SAM-dependent methyltransferase
MPTTEFDQYAAEYEELVREPIRDRFASDPEFFTRRKWELLEDYFRSRGRDTRQMDWLDVGCGTGTLLRMASKSFASASGCDPSRNMLDACEGIATRVQDPPTRLPFDSDSFDLVTMVCVLHHVTLEDRDALMTEVARVLKPQGLVCVIEHNCWNPVTRHIVSRVPVDRDAILLSPIDTRRLLEKNRLSYCDCRYFLYLPQRIYRLLGRLEQLGARIPLGGQYALFGQVA